VPSVLFDISLPENKDDSFYSGTIHVTVKDKVFTLSSAMRHATESINILRNTSSENGLSLNKPRLFIYTDGGPDHRTTFWSVQLAHIATFVSLDIDILIAARTAPSHSYANPAERCMSLLNLTLQNVALQRDKMNDNSEFKIKYSSSLKKLRGITEKQPALKTALIESLEPTISKLKHRFSKLKLHDEHVVVHDAATQGEIDSIMDIFDIFKDDEDSPRVALAKTAKDASKKLIDFIERHCRSRHYTFQVLTYACIKLCTKDGIKHISNDSMLP